MPIPNLKRVLRLDAMPLKAQYTAEGYLLDKPVLTSTGIFEYTNHDGSKRRELRLPEDVFDPESLKSYRGKPVVVTHDAGLITKDNVAENQIGTIISEGYQSGDDVRAEIIIHDTDEMKDSGFKQLSLGYNLDLEETPGVWRGEHYDAIQRNIRINHLALVREARAGEQARLNIDSRDGNSLLIGGKVMKKNPKKARRADGILSPEELQKAIEEYKAKRAKTDADEEPKQEAPVMEEPAKEEPKVAVAEDAEPEEVKAPKTPEEKVQFVKDRRDLRDEEGDPKDTDEAMVQIAHQDEDIQMLIDIIDTLLAERDFKETKKEEADSADEAVPDTTEEEVPAEENEDGCGKKYDDADEEIPDMTEEEAHEDADEEEIVEEEVAVDEDDTEETIFVEENEDEDEESGEELPRMNADSIDKIVRERIKIGMIGRLLNLDGLENVKTKTAKKAIINAVHPEMRLDGKSSTYIDVAYDLAVKEAKAMTKKDTNYQKKQMFNKDSAEVVKNENSSTSARDRMIERQMKRK